ncbi:MAG TPA: hypothetical protein VGQ58_05080 [Candidatus Limnocylindrales bacterium]|nr:hypothetical protein [Candidatus Limnocylindrales bacterium]
MAEADDQRRTVGELLGAAVVGRVELADGGIEALCELGDVRPLEGAGGDNYLARLEAATASPDRVAACAIRLVRRSQAIDSHAGLGRQTVVVGVGLEVIGHLPAGREGVARQRKRKPRQRVVPGRRVQEQRVVALAPDVADAAAGLEDGEVDAASGEVVPRRQASLAGADDNDLVAIGGRSVHWSSLRQVCETGTHHVGRHSERLVRTPNWSRLAPMGQ